MSINGKSKKWRTVANTTNGSCAPAVGCWWVVPVSTGASVVGVASMIGRLTLILRPRGGDFAISQYEGVKGMRGAEGVIIV